jgi:hypothetical protein
VWTSLDAVHLFGRAESDSGCTMVCFKFQKGVWKSKAFAMCEDDGVDISLPSITL